MAACGGCGFQNLAGERFCGGCGTSLAPSAAVSERRQVAILFADLAGYTRLSTTLDPEELHRLLAGFFEAVDGACLRYGGTIDKHIGDNVMAIFGAPVAHGDDPQRAVRAAVAIHDEVAAYAARVGRELRVHVGIAYGEVIASGLGSRHHQEYTVTGDAVNLAARLQDKAVGGETLVSEAVFRAAERIAIAEPVGDVAVKGLPEPVPVWRIRGIKAATAPRVQLVGRDAELAAIDAALAATATGAGALIVIRADPGLGKSALASEAMRRAAARGYTVHVGQVLDFGQGRGAGAMPMLVASLLGALTGAAGDPAAALIHAQTAGLIAASHAPHLATLLELDIAATGDLDERERTRRQHAALAALIAAQPGLPLLMVEDAHWADAADRARLHALGAAIAGRAAALIVTTRFDGDPIDAALRARFAAPRELELQPLAAADAVQLAAALVTDDDLVERCVARAGGNPLFLEQLVQAATRDASLPGTLQGVVLARVDRLHPRDKAALQAAAVVGQRFERALIAHLTGDPTWQPDELIARRLVSAGDGDALAFHHALILDSVYAALTHARRRELHGAAAGWFAPRDLELRAEHLERASDATAGDAWRACAEQLASKHEPVRALVAVERGLAIATADDDRHALAALGGRLQGEIGDGPAMLRLWSTALPLARDELARCRALIGMAAAHRLLSNTRAALPFLDDAEPIAVGLGKDVEQAQIAYFRGSLAFGSGDAGACRAHHERALAHAQRAAAPEWEVRALSGLGDALYATGEMEAASATFGQCVAVCERLGLRRYRLLNQTMFGIVRMLLGHPAESIRILDEVAVEARALGARRAEALVLESLVLTEVMAWRYQRASELMIAARAAIEAIDVRFLEGSLLWCEAEMVCAAGDRAAHAELVRRCEAYATGHESGRGPLAAATAATLAMGGAASPDELAELLASPALTGEPSFVVTALMIGRSAIECALRIGAWAVAEAQADRLDRIAPHIPLGRFVTRRARALGRWQRGDRDPDLVAELAELRALATARGFDPQTISR
jgi:class 3 adenylate cyclase